MSDLDPTEINALAILGADPDVRVGGGEALAADGALVIVRRAGGREEGARA